LPSFARLRPNPFENLNNKEDRYEQNMDVVLDWCAPTGKRRTVASADGKVTGRVETLAELKTMKWTGYAELKVTVFGDTAIATGDFSKGTDAAGKPFDVDIRWTDTWM